MPFAKGWNMIYVVNSLPKCASTWTFHVVDACLRDLGYSSVFDLAPWANRWGNPGKLESENLARLLSLNQTFCIKAHSENNPELKDAHRLGKMKSLFLIRNPIDIVLAALDYGERKRQIGEIDNPYHTMHHPEQALEFCRAFWPLRDEWLGHAMEIKYEDLSAHPRETLIRAFDYFDLPDPRLRIQSSVARNVDLFSPENLLSGKAPKSADHIRLNRLTGGHRRRRDDAPVIETLWTEVRELIHAWGYDD